MKPLPSTIIYQFPMMVKTHAVFKIKFFSIIFPSWNPQPTIQPFLATFVRRPLIGFHDDMDLNQQNMGI